MQFNSNFNSDTVLGFGAVGPWMPILDHCVPVNITGFRSQSGHTYKNMGFAQDESLKLRTKLQYTISTQAFKIK